MNPEEIVIIIPQDSQTVGESIPFCLLCGSRDSCYQLTSDIRDKWSNNLCYLYGIDLIEAKKVIENSCYCFDCHQELRTINQIYEEIERLDAKLESVKIKYAFQLRNLVQTLTDTGRDNLNSSNDQEVKGTDNPDVGKSEINIENVDDGDQACDNYSDTHDTNDHNVSHLSEEDDVFSMDQLEGIRIYESTVTVEEEIITGCVVVSDDSVQNQTHPTTSNYGDEVNPAPILIVLNENDYSASKPQELLMELPPVIELPEQKPEIDGNNEKEKEKPHEENELTKYLNLKRKYHLKDCFVKVEEMELEDVRLYLSKATGKDVNILPSFPCPFIGCGKRYPQKILTDAHFRSKHEGIGKPYSCNACDKSFKRHHILLEHQNVHLNLTPFDCPECDERFHTKEFLYNHIRKTHRKRFPQVLCEHCGENYQKDGRSKHSCQAMRDKGEGPPEFSCEVCSKTFKRRLNLDFHRAIHPELQLKQFKCKFCDKVLTTEKNYINHTSRHTGEFTYKCDLCEYGSTLVESMKKHALVHSDVKNFECEICQQRFKCLPQLRSHRNFKHSDGKFSMYCHICGILSCNKYTLERHLKSKHSDKLDKPYKCTLCSEGFLMANYLTKHMKRCHEFGKPRKGMTKKARMSRIAKSQVPVLVPVPEDPNITQSQ